MYVCVKLLYFDFWRLCWSKMYFIYFTFLVYFRKFAKPRAFMSFFIFRILFSWHFFFKMCLADEICPRIKDTNLKVPNVYFFTFSIISLSVIHFHTFYGTHPSTYLSFTQFHIILVKNFYIILVVHYILLRPIFRQIIHSTTIIQYGLKVVKRVLNGHI